MFGQSLLSAFGIACTTDTDQLFTTNQSATSLATYELNSNANSIPYTASNTSIATYQLNNATTSIPNNTYPGTASNITYAAGKFGNAAIFPNPSNSASTGIVSGFAPSDMDTTSYTFSQWMYFDDIDDEQYLFSNYLNSSGNYGFYAIKSSNVGNIIIDLFNTSNSNIRITSTALSAGQWYHLALTWNHSTKVMQFYIDGVLDQTSSALSGTVSTNSNGLRYGRADGAAIDDLFTGKLDQVRIFNSALPQAAITALYNETSTTAQNDYISYTAPSYNGTASNITYTAGKFGDAAVFNGSSSQITLPDSIGTAMGNNNFSVSFWVNVNSASADAIYLSITRPYDFYVATFSGVIYLNLGTLSYSTGISLSTGWHHIAVTKSSSSGSILYLDNNATADASKTGNITANNITNSIGDYNNGSYVVDGKIEQVRIFNTALPASAITALYNETTTTATSASIDYQLANPNSVAYYKMSDATDQLGNYNGTATNVNFNTEGKFGFAGAFNGSSSVITLPDTFSSTYEGSTTWSFSAWVDVNSSNADKNFFTKYNSSVQLGGIQIGTDASGYLNFFVANTSDQRQHNRGNTALSTNTWHHICVIWSSGTMYLYLNGSAETLTNLSNTYTGSTIPTTTTSSTKSNRFGAVTYSGGSTSYSDIKLDQIRIYDSALSAADVTTLYKEVECKPAAINALDHFNTVLYTGTGSSQAITGVGFAPDFIWIKDRVAANWHNLQNTITGATKHLYSNAANAQDTTSDGLTSFDSDGFTIGGGGGFGNNGNDFVAWNWKAPLANLSTSFNGSSSLITIANNAVFNFTTPTSMSVWVNRNTTNREFIIDKGNGSSGSYGWQFEFNVSEYVFQLNNTVGGIMDLRAAASGTGSWEHVVVTYDSNQVGKIYLNGVLKATDTMAGTASFNTNGVTIGTYSLAPSGYRFEGKLAQVRFFNSTLSASEVADLYTEPAASNNTLNYPAGAGCIAAYPLQTDAVDLSGNYSGASSNVTFGQPGYLTGNTDGTIPSAVAVNTDAGFSIVKFTISNPVSSQTIGHGLGGQPELIISKTTSDSGDWYTFHKDVGTGKYLTLNSTSAETSYANGYSTVNSTVWQQYFRSDAESHVAYCFKSIPGYSKIGSYVGTGATGNFQYMGFQPRYVMTKNMQDGDAWDRWYIQDSVRGGGKILYANASLSEGNYTSMQFDSTGFTLNTTDSGINESGKNYIYLAIA